MKLSKKKHHAVTGDWLISQRAALLASGLSDRELNLLEWRDVEGLNLAACGKKIERTPERASQIYWKARRKLSNPSRKHLVPLRFRLR